MIWLFIYPAGIFFFAWVAGLVPKEIAWIPILLMFFCTIAIPFAIANSAIDDLFKGR